MRWHDVALTWNNTKDHNRSQKLCFHRPGHVPVIRGNPDLHFEGAGNGPFAINWIGREHELYSGASPISLVEHCVTFRHDRRLLSLLGFAHNWITSRWSATKKKRFSLNGNGIMSSFLGQQFYLSTLYSIEGSSHQLKLMVFHRSMSDWKSPQVSRIFLSILADINSTVVLMVSARPHYYYKTSQHQGLYRYKNSYTRRIYRKEQRGFNHNG